jgi:TetR/AcrR family transcriptional regulator, cholesterol catabolism regulator
MPRAAGRRAEILDAFIRHVAERGYDQANLGDIAGELGMSKGTIVHHFGTKAQLLRELEETYMRRRVDVVHQMWSRLESPAERIAAVIYSSALSQIVERDATVATQREVVQLADDPAMQDVRKFRRELQQLTSDEIQAGINGGVFRAVDVDVATMQLWGFLQWMWVWFDPNGSRTPEETGAAFVDVFVGGLLVDRFGLQRLTDPAGPAATVARESLEAVIGDDSSGSDVTS